MSVLYFFINYFVRLPEPIFLFAQFHNQIICLSLLALDYIPADELPLHTINRLMQMATHLREL